MSKDGFFRWINLVLKHAARRPFAVICLALPLLVTLILLLQSVVNLSNPQFRTGLVLGVTAGFGGFVATTLGALPALFLSSIPSKLEDTILGFSAGMMLSAAVFSLIIPGIDVAQVMVGGRFIGVGLVALGICLGSFLMLGLEQLTPHVHQHSDDFGVGPKDLRRIWLFIFAIAIHNLPEGMAMGVSFSKADWSVGLPMSTAIAIQDLPEGLVVALTLRSAQVRSWIAVLVAALTGLLEPLGALIGGSLAHGAELAYPIGLGFAAGAMIFVVSHEVIPETHRNGHQTPSTLGLIGGFIIMMVLDKAFS